jgi:hypothetical protein
MHSTPASLPGYRTPHSLLSNGHQVGGEQGETMYKSSQSPVTVVHLTLQLHYRNTFTSTHILYTYIIMPASRTSSPLMIDSKPYSRPRARGASKPKPKYVDVDPNSDVEATPPLSSADGNDNDRSSDFAETPSPSPNRRNNKVALYHSDDDEEYDIDQKPELDDDVSSPGIVSDPYVSEVEENYRKSSKTKAKSKAKGQAAKNTTPKKLKSPSVGGSGKKPGVAWTPEEDWMLFQYLHPKIDKPNWTNVSTATGRDAKVSRPRLSCLLP